MNYRLNYNANNELQESPVIESTTSKQAPPSTKKVWRLKKYHRSEDEIKTQQENYENLEFNTKKTSTRRPKSKNGQQEFVFIDLSPTKKSTTKDDSTTTPKKQGRVSRLFRLNSTNEELKESSAPPVLVSSKPPQLSRSQSQLLPNTIPSLPPHQQPVQPPIQHPGLKRSYTTANSRYNSEKSASSASLVMTVSENGRAILQPTASRTLSTSSSVSDLFSLTRMNSTRHSPIPSPRRMESPIHNQHLEDFYEYNHNHHHNNHDEDYIEDDEMDSADDSDATKAFSKIIRKKSFRKRANTASSNNSIISSSPAVPRLLQRNQSISSMNSLYKSRISPSRSTLMLRQSTLLQQQHHQQHQQQPLYSPQEQNESSFTSFFDDIHKNSSKPTNLHKKTTSISDFTAQLGPPLEINSSDNDPESPYTANTDVMLPFEFTTGDLDHTSHTTHDENFDDTLKPDDDQQIFDFNAFINYEESHNY